MGDRTCNLGVMKLGLVSYKILYSDFGTKFEFQFGYFLYANSWNISGMKYRPICSYILCFICQKGIFFIHCYIYSYTDSISVVYRDNNVPSYDAMEILKKYLKIMVKKNMKRNHKK